MDGRRVATLALVVAVAVSLTVMLAPRGQPTGDSKTWTAQTVVVFRNDDVTATDNVELRRTVERIFVEADVPVTHAVVPNSDGRLITDDSTVCEELNERQGRHPDLVEYALHGYNHSPRPGGFSTPGDGFDRPLSTEFGGLRLDEQRERLRKGITAFEACLGSEPAVFVPPFGTYDETTVNALATSNVTVVSGGGWFVRSYFDRQGVFETAGVLHVPRDQGFVADWDTNAFYDQRELRERFDAAHERGGLYVHVLHHWTFDSADRRDQLRGLLSYMKRHDDVRFMTLSEFADAYRDGRLERTADGWSYQAGSDQSND